MEWVGRWKPRCRFDCEYLKQSEDRRVQVVRFGFAGEMEMTKCTT